MILAILLAVAEPADTSKDLFDAALDLYDEVCLKTFPDDMLIDTSMTLKGAKPLSPEDVRVTLVDDPGRGWSLKLKGRTISIFLELPPFHACSVRFPQPEGKIDYSSYNSLIAKYKISKAGFERPPAYDLDRDEIHIHAIQDVRRLPEGGAESLLAIDQHVIEPKRRAKGETGSAVRFVHQFVSKR